MARKIQSLGEISSNRVGNTVKIAELKVGNQPRDKLNLMKVSVSIKEKHSVEIMKIHSQEFVFNFAKFREINLVLKFSLHTEIWSGFMKSARKRIQTNILFLF